MIEVKEYPLSEFLQEIGVTTRQWNTRKEEVKESLEDSFDYRIEIRERGKKYIVIREIYQQYIPIGRKKSKTLTEQKYKDYSKYALLAIYNKPLNSVANLSRCAAEDEELSSKYSLVPKSIEKYIRPYIRSNKFCITDKKWVYLHNNNYIMLTKDQEDDLNSYFKNSFDEYGLDVVQIIADQQSGLLSIDEVKETLFATSTSKYEKAIEAFKQKYGFRPFKVPYIEINMLELTEEERILLEKCIEEIKQKEG